MSDVVGYINFGSIKGDSQDTNHKEWVEVTNISQSIFRNINPTSKPREALTSSQVQINGIMVQKKGDSSSPEFVAACCQGKVFPEVQIDLVKTTDKGREAYYTWKLTNAYVANYDFGASGGGGISSMESMSLCFETISWEFKKTDEAGKPAGGSTAGWDISKNEAI